MLTINEQITALTTATLTELKSAWRSAFKMKPPPTQREAIIWRLSYHMQEQAYGALPKRAANKLQRLAFNGQQKMQEKYLPMPGTRLMREWEGKQHYVTILYNTFEYRGRHYTSLSAIAREITGTSYSGPRFFKLGSYRHEK